LPLYIFLKQQIHVYIIYKNSGKNYSIFINVSITLRQVKFLGLTFGF